MVEKVLPLLVTIRAGYKQHNNVTHLQLHQRLHQLVTGYDKQKLTLTDDDLTSWRTSIDGEVDNNNRRKASELVKQLNDLDKKRAAKGGDWKHCRGRREGGMGAEALSRYAT